jgi:rfaE bifunctional protein nucleotidyltransferase chain/domain
MCDLRAKIVSLQEAVATVARLRAEGKRIVFTNGCFDILHSGHALYLQEAGKFGDFLIVALNSDSSVRQLKGEGRPIIPEIERATLLAALESVDMVLLFDKPDCLELLDLLGPEVWVKGGDYTKETLNQEERRLVESRGGEIILIPPTPATSTTTIIERVLSSRGKQGS